jgi:hypothetical protein
MNRLLTEGGRENMQQTLAAKCAKLVCVIGGVGAIFFLINLLHFRFLRVEVLMYAAFLDILVASALVAIAIALTGWLQLASIEVFFAIVIGALISAIYVILVPTLIDRSLSVYMLEKIHQRGGGIRKDAFLDIWRGEYLLEYRVVDTRLTEQVASGTLVIRDGCVLLTPRGKAAVGFTAFVRRHLLPQKRDILGDITDELTDPFRNSSPTAGYTCN